VAAFFSEAAVLCQPNTAPEAFGLTFIEAMGQGLPVVTSNIGSATELFANRDCGRLCDANDAAAVAGAISAILNDPELRKRMSLAARRRAWEISNPRARLAEMEQSLRTAAGGGFS
jgi:glycosyltransferase involved in cell wall biosynthesis